MKPSDAFEAAKKTYEQKNPRYGEQWRSYEIISLVDIVRGKGSRIKQAVMVEDWDDALEELEDEMNFAAMAWCKIQEEHRND